MHWSDEELMQLVDDLIEELPEDIRSGLDNVSMLIQDLPTPEQLRRVRIQPDRLLLGLYEGTPLSKQSVFHAMTFPAAIILFRANIERVAGNRENVKDELRLTLFHEIGHHLGFNEDDLRQRGL